MKHSNVLTYVTAATASSIILLFVTIDKSITKRLAAKTKTARRTFELSTTLQTITGINTSIVRNGDMIARIVLSMNGLESAWMCGSLEMGVERRN